MVSAAIRLTRPHAALVTASFRSQLSYRISVVLMTIGAALATFMDYVMIVAIMAHLPRLDGWSLAEVGLLYGIAGVAFGLTDSCIGTLDLLPRLIKEGAFDVVLVRPIGSLFQVIATEVAIRRIGKVVQSGGVLVISLAHLDVHWTPERVAMLVAAPVTGAVIFGAIWVTVMAHVFWTVDSGEVTNAFTYGGAFMTSYPISVFAGWLRDLLAFVVPMAFVAYYPTLFILGRPDPIGLPAFAPLLTPAVALVLVAVACVVWRFGVRHYRGTGS